MIIKLGYIATPITFDDITYCKTITYTNYKKLNRKDAYDKLSNIIKENFKNLEKILSYNYINDIYFYRITHNFIPLATIPNIKYDFLSKFKKEFKLIGNLIKKYNFRIDSHPDQYCSLSSNRYEVIENSIRILKFHDSTFKAMDLDSKMIIHVGGRYDSKDEAIKRFIYNFKQLPISIKKRIILENDDKIYTVSDILKISEELGIPMVLDYHHYICNNNKEKLNDYLPRIFATWKNTGLNPKIHFSSPKSRKEKRSHSTYIKYNDFVKFIKLLKEFDQDIDVMLECKGKDEALFRLVRQLKFKTTYKFINNSTFIV